MAVELLHDGPTKFAIAGLDLNVPVDLVPPTKYSKLTNAVSKIEGQLQSRDGSTLVANVSAGTPIHSIFRLTQPNPQVVSERLVGSGGSLYTAPLPAGNVFTALSGGPTFDGLPLSIVEFRFTGDPVGIWAIIANSVGMMKRRSNYYQILGLAPPTAIASATAGGSGTLNSSTGTQYDWRYTYLNPITLSESNPSPINIVPTITRPTTFTNPSTVGDTVFLNPANAIDGSAATFAQGIAAITSSGFAETSCSWQAAAANAVGILTVLNLNITRSASMASTGTGSASVVLQYSLDGGTTFKSIEGPIVSHGGSFVIAQSTLSIALPLGTDFTQLVIRSSMNCRTVTGGTASVTYNIYDINLTAVAASGTTNTLALTNQSANVCVTAPVDPQETAIRLYRRGGTLPNNWFYVGQFTVASLVQGSCGAGTLLINDNVPDSIAEIGQILSIDNFQPIQSVQATAFPLPIIFGPSNGMVLACGDPARPDSVYFSQSGNADIWPAENWVVVANPGEQIMNGINYSLRTFAFSRERMYIMLPNIIAGVTFTPAETSCRRGLKGRFALCAGEQGVYFVAKDGVYRTQGGPEQSIVDDSIRPLFPTREATTGVPVNGYDAIDMTQENALRLTYHNGEVWFDYIGLTTQTLQRIIFDERRTRWRSGIYSPLMQMSYSEPNTTSSLLYGGSDGSLYQGGGTSDNSISIPVEILTGAMDQTRPMNLKEYLTIDIDLDPGGATPLSPITIIPRINGGLISEAALAVTGSGRQRVTLPLNQGGMEIYGYNLEFDISWLNSPTVNPILYQYETLYRNEPAELTHWELPHTTMGIDGWFHIRDGYMMMRSTAPVTLTVTPDINAGYPVQTFILPSTGGKKQKLFFQLQSNKGKSYAFKLDSAATFRLYADDSQIRVKEWLTKSGYKSVPLIGREQVGKPFGLVSV